MKAFVATVSDQTCHCKRKETCSVLLSFQTCSAHWRGYGSNLSFRTRRSSPVLASKLWSWKTKLCLERDLSHIIQKQLLLDSTNLLQTVEVSKHERITATVGPTSSESKSTDQPKESTKASFDTVLQELTSIQKDGPSSIAILGTRHCSLLHQQIVELLTYANVLIGNHIYTSGGGGTNSAAIRGALRAEKPHLLTVILPQSRSKQPKEAQELLKHVAQVIEMPHNDNLPLDVSSRLCNSSIISKCQQLISFVFHDSDVLLEAVKESKALKKLVTLLYLD
eukprot:jgi/Galph1/5099/GphlegSOOS_G3779.1